MQQPTPQRGVTLIETAITVAVIGVVISTVSPSFSGFIDNRRIDAVAASLHTDIQFVRQEAVLRNLPVRLSFHTEAWGSWRRSGPTSPHPKRRTRPPRRSRWLRSSARLG